jgi:hypothetical protein
VLAFSGVAQRASLFDFLYLKSPRPFEILPRWSTTYNQPALESPQPASSVGLFDPTLPGEQPTDVLVVA